MDEFPVSTTWRKSSDSQSEGGGQCVELARLAEAVGVRDSKNPEAGHLAIPRETFAKLVNRLKH